MAFLSSSSNNNNYNNIYAFNSFINTILHNTCHDRFMHLKIFVDINANVNANGNGLKELYVNYADSHNQKIMSDPHFFDAGFDLFLPKNTWFDSGKVNKIDFKVKCCAKIHYLSMSDNTSRSYFTGFYTHPRSSLSKTPLRLANSTGIIDAGYRGNLIGMFDCFSSNNNNNSNNSSSSSSSSSSNDSEYSSEQFSRLLQICAPGLIPIYVEIVDNIEELGPSTSRGAGGIGSTGI